MTYLLLQDAESTAIADGGFQSDHDLEESLTACYTALKLGEVTSGTLHNTFTTECMRIVNAYDLGRRMLLEKLPVVH